MERIVINSKKFKKNLFIVFFIFSVTLLTYKIVTTFFYYPMVLLTPSVDAKLVVCEVKPARNIKQGDLITFIYKGKEFPEYKVLDGERVAKFVVAVPGDKLVTGNNFTIVNGEIVGIVRHKDSKGKPVKPFVWNGTVPEGCYFVMGSNPFSFDSRYWGFIRKDWNIHKCYIVF